MAHRFGERDPYQRGEHGPRSAGSRYEHGDRHDRDIARGQRRVQGSGSEYFGQVPESGEREPYGHGSFPPEHAPHDHSAHQAGGHRDIRTDDEYRDRGYGHGYGSGYGGQGDAPGEAGGSLDSGRSYSAEPGWGPGYGAMSGKPRGPRGFEGERGRGAASQDPMRGPSHQDMRHESAPMHGRGGYSSGAGSSGYPERSHRGGADPWDQQRGSPSRGGRPQWRGPKGYQRSDERMTEDIAERLMAMGHYVDASDVSIEVKDAIVTLSGSVPERRMKHAIEDAVDECMGVKDIDNRIRVGEPHHGSEQAGAIGSGNASMSIGGGSQSSISGMGGTSGSQE